MWDIRAVPAQAKRDIAYRQSTTTLRTKPGRANEPFTALLQQASLGVGYTASPDIKKHVRSGKNADQFKVPLRGVGGCHGMMGEITLNGVTSNCPKGAGSPAPRGRQPARELGRNGTPPSITSRCWPCSHTLSEGAATNKTKQYRGHLREYTLVRT